MEFRNGLYVGKKLAQNRHRLGWHRMSEIATPIALERHYTVREIAKMWAVSENTVRRTFANEVGVLIFGSEESRYKRKRVILRVPESVLIRVHQQQRAA